MHELPLILFTLCMQAAVGAVIWSIIIRFKSQEKSAIFKTNTLVALIVSAVGMVASLLHLGKPLLAATSLSNLFSSWLSREIFFCGGFFVLLLIFWWLERSEKTTAATDIVAWLAGLAGLAGIFCMAQLYMKTIIPAWQSVNTLVDFYATTIILGGVIFYISASKSERENLPRLDLVILAAVFVQIAFIPGYIAGVGALAGAGQESAALLAGSYGIMTIIRWLLTLGGIFLFVLSQTGKLAGQNSFLYTAVAVLLVGEFIGRFLFYISGVPTGIGIL